eukprot:gene13312-28203_t
MVLQLEAVKLAKNNMPIDKLKKSVSFDVNNITDSAKSNVKELNICTKICNIGLEIHHILCNIPRQLFIVLILTFCSMYSYCAFGLIIVIYLHKEFNASDLEAGTIFGMFGAFMTLWGLLASQINDRIGVKKSLILSYTSTIISYLILAFTHSKYVFIIICSALLPFGLILGSPMLNLAVHRCSTESTRALYFGFAYSAYNIASFLSGPVVDILTIDWRPNPHTKFTLLRLSGSRLLLLSCCFSSFCGLLVTIFYLKEHKTTTSTTMTHSSLNQHHTSTINTTNKRGYDINNNNHSNRVNNHTTHTTHRDKDLERDTDLLDIDGSDSIIGLLDTDNHNHHHNHNHDMDTTTTITTSTSTTSSPSSSAPSSPGHPRPHHTTLPLHRTWKETIDMCRTATFFRFSLLSLALLGLNGVFVQFDASFPTYLLREFGENVPKGSIFAINPLIIICLAPTVAVISSHCPDYDMIKLGSYISAFSLLFPVFSTSIWSSVCMVVVFSIGEAIWAPRVQDYTMTVAPEGREASFMALSSAPMLVAQIPLGIVSGLLVSDFLPDDSRPQRPQTMWLVFAVLA